MSLVFFKTILFLYVSRFLKLYSLSLSISHSLYLFIYLSIYLCLSLHFFLSISHSISISPSLPLTLMLCVDQSSSHYSQLVSCHPYKPTMHISQPIHREENRRTVLKYDERPPFNCSNAVLTEVIKYTYTLEGAITLWYDVLHWWACTSTRRPECNQVCAASMQFTGIFMNWRISHTYQCMGSLVDNMDNDLKSILDIQQVLFPSRAY